MTVGWGVERWGLDVWGGVDPEAPIGVAALFARSTNSIRVMLTREPQHKGGFYPGDALNSRTWTVTQPVTGKTYTIIAVQQVSATVYDIYVLEKLGPLLTNHRLVSNGLRALDGSAANDNASSGDFAGVVDVRASDPQTAARRYVTRDLANPPTPVGLDTVAGTLVATSDGDYATEAGEALLRKLILRRLTTVPGEFFHLPNYGLGFRVKEPLRINDLPKLKVEVERQIQLEPDVERVHASISLNADGLFTVALSVRMKSTGESFDMGLRQTPTELVSF